MKIKTSELTGPALDWAVAICENKLWDIYDDLMVAQADTLPPRPSEYLRDHDFHPDEFSPSTCWAQGGPIIDRELIQLTPHCMVNPLHGWAAAFRSFDEDDNVFALHRMRGRTPLLAAMRCYVASKLGDEVDVPEELL